MGWQLNGGTTLRDLKIQFNNNIDNDNHHHYFIVTAGEKLNMAPNLNPLCTMQRKRVHKMSILLYSVRMKT